MSSGWELLRGRAPVARNMTCMAKPKQHEVWLAAYQAAMSGLLSNTVWSELGMFDDLHKECAKHADAAVAAFGKRWPDDNFR